MQWTARIMSVTSRSASTPTAAAAEIACPHCRFKAPFTAVAPAVDFANELAATVVRCPPPMFFYLFMCKAREVSVCAH